MPRVEAVAQHPPLAGSGLGFPGLFYAATESFALFDAPPREGRWTPGCRRRGSEAPEAQGQCHTLCALRQSDRPLRRP